MKCLKCGYLGFETGERCRNCGYDFSLTGLIPEPDEPGPLDEDLRLRPEHETAGPLADVSLRPPAGDDPTAGPDAAPPSDVHLDLDRLIGGPEPVPPEPSPPAGSATPPRSASTPSAPGASPAYEQTLFPGETDEAASIPRRRTAPRPPLSVRRATPEVPRVRPRPTPRTPRTPLTPRTGPDAPPLAGLGLAVEPSTARRDAATGADPARRVAAALVDLAVLAAIDGLVVYFTLRLAGLAPAQVLVLPPTPLVSFFLLLNGGYFVAFAALGGQTIGQMAFGLKVVGADGMPVTFGTATFRTAAWLVSTLPLGLGLWFAFAADHRALHDRLTATRVVPS